LIGPGLFAQQAKVWRVGFLSQRHVDFVDSDGIYGPFTQGMRELGYVLGKNLAIEWRSSERTERLPELAAELVRLNLDILVTQGTPASHAAQNATNALPIVMINVGDPVGAGLVKSLARPGGNSTGLSINTAELGPKLLELLRDMAPKATRVAVLVNPSNASTSLGLQNIRAVAQKAGVEILPIEARTPKEIENGFAAMARLSAEALIVSREALFTNQKTQVVELAAKQHLPAIGTYGEFVTAGGLMSYGQNIQENYRRAATYVDRIFKGAKPGAMAIEQPTKFELVINVKTAKALGISVPQSMLVRADRIIE
jgi:putative ABC transport system substrate-binding protein